MQVDVRALSDDIESITIHRANGQDLSLLPDQNRLSIEREHPPVDRMEDDLGAICAVFKDAHTYFLTVHGVTLSPGDRLELAYTHHEYRAVVEVIEQEDGRVIIRPPRIMRL